MTLNYWLIKSEPDVFSIDDLINSDNQTTYWDGVRNYQARNFMRDQMKKGDLAIFYHSNTEPPSAVGIVKVSAEGYPDFTAFDPEDKHYDPKSSSDKPRWYMVDVTFEEKFNRAVPLSEIKENEKLQDMALVRRGNRLSVMPVTKEEFDEIVKLGTK